MAVHPDPGEERQLCFSAEVDQGCERATGCGYQVPEVLHERLVVVGFVLANDFTNLGFEVVDFMIPDTPPHGCWYTGEHIDHFLFQLVDSNRWLNGREEPPVIGADY